MSERDRPKYSAKLYEFPPEFVNEISVLRSSVTYIHIFFIWLCIAALSMGGAFLYKTSYFWMAYPLLGLLIASRQGALLQIVHEGSHRLISNNRTANDFAGNWLAALPVGLTLEGYTRGHMRHHAGTNTPDDLETDLEKYSVTDLKNPQLYKLFLMDLLGITALKSFFGHNYKSLENKLSKTKEESSAQERFKILRLGTSQLLVLSLIFQFNFVLYLLLWAIPLISFNMVLLRVRGITEHGAPKQFEINIETADQGNFYTRSVVITNPTWMQRTVNLAETILIGSLSANFHHEHHLLPKVPFYNLKKVHMHANEKIYRNNKYVYVPSYFSTLFQKKREDAST